MCVELLGIGVQMRKVLIISIRFCFRTVSNHPFLVGILCFLSLLYRSFPFLFSALVSISPVIVCTAVLLGTLLSFGHPNTPEIEREEKTVHDILVTLKSGVLCDVEKDESYSVKRYIDKEWDIIEKESREVQFESRAFDEAARYLYDLRSVQKNKDEERLGDGEVLECQYSPYQNMDDNNLEFGFEKYVDSFDSKMVSIDKQEEEEKGYEEEDESLDSGTDRAESSSSDTSMANIIPMLDELHPLLDEDTPPPVNLSRADFDAEFKHSDSEDEFNDGIVHQGELETADDENEDGEDEEEDMYIQGDDEECNKSAITWTEEDQKNLMDLGSSELERNQRLENLIARRREQKSTKELAETNLIESVDLPFNVAPVSTARKNPFDIPDDQNDLRLPPIPGSAPSILLPRRNPFDLPYDEKPDLMEDSFQKELITFGPKEPFFRRHESFNVQPNKHGKDDIRLRPYFFPERMMESEGASYTPFQRQSSDLSDSKVSSVPETESTGSVSDLEDKDFVKENIEDGTLNDKDLSFGIETEFKQDHEETHHDQGPCLIQEGNVANMSDFSPIDINSRSPSFEQNYHWHSNSSSLSETSEKNFVQRREQWLSGFDLSNLDTNKDITVGCQQGLEKQLKSQYDEGFALTNASMNNFPPMDHKQVQEPPFILVESDAENSLFDELEIAKHIHGSENHEVLLETVDCHGKMQHLIECTDGINNIDEELISVGGFIIKESGSSLNEFGSKSGSSKRVILHKDSSLIENDIEFEARSTEDNSERHFLHDSVDVKVNTAESSDKPMKLNSKDGLLEAGPDEGDSFKYVESSLKAFHVPEGSKGDTRKLHFEHAYHEVPKHDSSSIMDVTDKQEDSLESDESSSSSSNGSDRE